MDANSEDVPQTEVVVTDMAPEENAEQLEASVEPGQNVNHSIGESNVDSSLVVVEKESDEDTKESDEIPTTNIAKIDSIVVADTETPSLETAATENPAIAVVETEFENLTTTEIDSISGANYQDVPIDKTSNNASESEMETEHQINAKLQVEQEEETKFEDETESEDRTESVTEEDIVLNTIDLAVKSEAPSEAIESQTALVKESTNKKGTDLKEKSNGSSDITAQKPNEFSDERISNDQKTFNNQIQDIISDIDINIKTQEKITQLKEQELKLIQKQNELTNQIQQQQILAQQLTAQNQFKQKQWEQQQIEQQTYQRDGLSSAQSHLHTAYNQSDDGHNKKETTNLSKSVDLRKIFTPATDAVEILPKNHYQQYQPKPATSPNILPAYSDAGKHRVQLNIHQDQLIEKYSKPGLQVVKSPWEAALQTGSASSAFLEESKPPMQTVSSTVPKTYFHSGGNDLTDAVDPVSYDIPLSNQQESYKESLNQHVKQQSSILPSNPQRELAYKPSVAQGWGGRNVELPRGLYVPKEISLASYAPPPKNFTDQQPAYSGHNISNINTTYEHSHRHLPTATSNANEKSMGTCWGFPVSKPMVRGFSTIPLKQQFSAPAGYQKILQTSAQGSSQVNFNPSPLSFEKLSKFEQSNLSYPNQNQNFLNVRQNSLVQNVSPTPFVFGSSESRFSVENASRSPSSTVSTSPQPLRSPCMSTRYGQPSTNTVPRLTSSSQAQTFNNCARGWGTEPESQYIYPGPNVLPVPGNMPYSDF
ncbi:AF4/FMR2 family member lilli isoform X7 [Drosophila guanche]|uniref:AF4/FMR2 family member lilli isoform X7 n=1 Tax=Drosophila guanche TaxID=7266 RepID=UPI001470D4AC|nr:AF4/FMR2 family member lilli isoform X7 [Drosophila guanche]